MELVSNVRENILSKLYSYILGAMLLFACAQISIPLSPVPITLQTVGIMLIALNYNFKDGIMIYLLYLLSGILGLPVFAQLHFGINTVIGNCLGYFVGFFFAIVIMNYTKNIIGKNSFIKILVTCLVGTFMIYFFGVLWLTYLYGLEQAFAVGLFPFIFPGILKSAILSGILRLIK